MSFKSPQSFVFSSLYFILVLFLFYISSFLVFWCVMEVSSVVFIGAGYSLIHNSFSFFLTFFVIQTLAAFLLLFFFIFELSFFFSLSMLLKLSMFPFHFWFIGLVQYFPNSIFFMLSTVFKIPSVILMIFYQALFAIPFMVFCCLFNLLVSGVMMCGVSSFRFLLLISAVGNNSWFLFSAFLGVLPFLLFVFVYSLFLFILLYLTGYGAALFVNSSGTFFILLCLASMSGLPPFPVFFVKMYIIYGLVFSGFYGVFVGFLMLLTLLMSVGYLAYFFKTFLVLGSNSGFLV